MCSSMNVFSSSKYSSAFLFRSESFCRIESSLFVRSDLFVLSTSKIAALYCLHSSELSSQPVSYTHLIHCICNRRRKLPPGKHKKNTQFTHNNTGMRQNLPDRFFPVCGSGKNCQSGSPHHDPLRNQINTGKHQPLCPVNPLCYRISQKPCV